MSTTHFLEHWGEQGALTSETIECGLALTPSLAADLVRHIKPGTWIFLNGDLGAGKTTFTQFLLRALGYAGQVQSPTFSIINVMNIQAPRSAINKVCHLDLYRLKNAAELNMLGLEIEFTSGALAIIEWAENMDVEGWQDFFAVTRCRRPSQLIGLSVQHGASGESRIYRLDMLDLQQDLGI